MVILNVTDANSVGIVMEKNDDVKNKRDYKEADEIAYLAIESYNAIKTKGLDITEGARYYHTYVKVKMVQDFSSGWTNWRSHLL